MAETTPQEAVPSPEESVEAVRMLSRVAGNSQEDPAERMEAAAFLFEHDANYRVPYLCFLDLYRQGHFQGDILSILTEAFYTPNERDLRSCYRRNMRLLQSYPYLFRKDFPDFEALPIRFYPYDEGKYVPFYPDGARFGGLFQVDEPVIRHYFFRDLEKPVLAENIFSQYELEYLNDCVRPSEWVGRDNHVYLHYQNWEEFCAWLQILDLRPLVEAKKAVFLMGEELAEYPLDFQARFGVDYSQYPVRPVGLREIHRMIWHTQLSFHNGGDFFNEVFDAHPNLIARPSLFFEDIEKYIQTVRDGLAAAHTLQEAQKIFAAWKNPALVEDLFHLKNPTDKDLFTALYLADQYWHSDWNSYLDPNARIAPAIFFQPHFPHSIYHPQRDEDGRIFLDNHILRDLSNWPVFQGFRYIKTFTPMRRFTTSHGGSIRFVVTEHATEKQNRDMAKKHLLRMDDNICDIVLNRTFMVDPEDRLWKDCVVVRFEDGKLNPKATFTALAAFLDLPYAETMNYCSEGGVVNPQFGNNVVGFDTATVYRTYDEYCSDSERCFIEYCLRDAYQFYGYDFHYYDGGPMDQERMDAILADFGTLDGIIRKIETTLFGEAVKLHCNRDYLTKREQASVEENVEAYLDYLRNCRREIASLMMGDLQFTGEKGQPLRMMPLLRPDPALMEQELYH